MAAVPLLPFATIEYVSGRPLGSVALSVPLAAASSSVVTAVRDGTGGPAASVVNAPASVSVRPFPLPSVVAAPALCRGYQALRPAVRTGVATPISVAISAGVRTAS